MAKRWAKSLDLKEGKLRGWTATDGPEKRRRALRTSVNADGYATTVRRLQVLINLDSPAKVQSAAKADIAWLQRTFRKGGQREQGAEQAGEGRRWRTRSA